MCKYGEAVRLAERAGDFPCDEHGVLEREQQLPIADAVLIAREVAHALGEAHGLPVLAHTYPK